MDLIHLAIIAIPYLILAGLSSYSGEISRTPKEMRPLALGSVFLEFGLNLYWILLIIVSIAMFFLTSLAFVSILFIVSLVLSPITKLMGKRIYNSFIVIPMDNAVSKEKAPHPGILWAWLFFIPALFLIWLVLLFVFNISPTFMTFVDIVVFVVGAGLGFFFFTMIIMPALYSFPKALTWYIKKRVKASGFLISLIAPLMWSTLLLIVVWLLLTFASGVFDFLRQSAGFSIGVFIAFWFAFTGPLLRRSSRDAIYYDFLKLLEPHVTPEFETNFSKQLSSLENKISEKKTSG